MKSFLTALTVFLLFTSISTAADESLIIDVDESKFSARDIGGGPIEGGFNVSSGQIHYWNAPNWASDGGYSVLDSATGTVTNMGRPASVSTNGFGDPFGVYNSQHDSFYAASYLNSGTSCLYKYDYGTSSWSEEGTAVNMYGGDVYNGDLYISGLREPWTGGYDNTFVSLYDFSHLHAHDALIEVGGASAHVALDNQGNVYYGKFEPAGTAALYRWTADQVAGVVDDLAGGAIDTYLTLDDGQKLADLEGGANGLAVDDAGNIFFTFNGASSSLCMWDGTIGDGFNYDVIATLDPSQSFGWFGPLAIEGNFLEGAPLYGSYSYGGPITEITANVPEPATIAVLGLGGFFLRRRKKA